MYVLDVQNFLKSLLAMAASCIVMSLHVLQNDFHLVFQYIFSIAF